jgi:hypothetical protein
MTLSLTTPKLGEEKLFLNKGPSMDRKREQPRVAPGDERETSGFPLIRRVEDPPP